MLPSLIYACALGRLSRAKYPRNPNQSPGRHTYPANPRLARDSSPWRLCVAHLSYLLRSLQTLALARHRRLTRPWLHHIFYARSACRALKHHHPCTAYHRALMNTHESSLPRTQLALCHLAAHQIIHPLQTLAKAARVFHHPIRRTASPRAICAVPRSLQVNEKEEPSPSATGPFYTNA